MMTFKVRTDTGAGRNLWDKLTSVVRTRTKRAEAILAEQVMKDTDKYVPALTGALSQTTHLEANTIVYPGPYARFLYYGKVMIYEPTGSTWAPKNQHKVVTDRDLVMHKTMHSFATSHWFEVSKAQNMEKWNRVSERLVNNGR